MKIFDYPPLIKTDPITEDKKKKIEEMSELVTEFRKKIQNKDKFGTVFVVEM